MNSRNSYIIGIVTGIVSGVLSALTAYSSIISIAQGGSATVLIFVSALVGAVIGAIIAFIVGKLGRRG